MKRALLAVPTEATRHLGIMLDSGAYSAWNKKTDIDFDEYVAFIEANKHLVEVYVNLDIIPPLPRSSATIEIAAKASYDNLQRMKKLGLKPLPVFHMGERWYWLERMLDDGEDYIGLSARKGLFPDAHIRALDETFTLLTKVNGAPLIKTHGFGITSHRLLVRYPWTTVDSTTWSMSSGMGKIVLPQFNNGKWDYQAQPVHVVVSGRPQMAAAKQLRHVGLFGPVLKKRLNDYLAEMGLTLTDVRNDDGARRHAILHFYLQVEKHVKVTRFAHRLPGFLRAAPTP